VVVGGARSGAGRQVILSGDRADVITGGTTQSVPHAGAGADHLLALAAAWAAGVDPERLVASGACSSAARQH
jgi:hypothetical protein